MKHKGLLISGAQDVCGMAELMQDWLPSIFLIFGDPMTDKPVFTDPFYIDKFMEIQQQNIVLYKSLLKIYEHEKIRDLIEQDIDKDIFGILKKCPA